MPANEVLLSTAVKERGNLLGAEAGSNKLVFLGSAQGILKKSHEKHVKMLTISY